MWIRRTALVVTIVLLLSACKAQPGEPQTCDADAVVTALRSSLPYDEATLSRNVLYETRYLNLWFVDPALDPSAGGAAIAANASQAWQDAIDAVHGLRAANACVPQLWDGINVVVVDRDYNDWLSGSIAPQDLPEKASLSQGDRRKLSEKFQTGYARQRAVVPVEAPAPGSCTWAEVHAVLKDRFDAAEEATVYLVVEEQGSEVWAQWAGPDPKTGTDPLLDALVLVAEDLGCLHPPVDTLWVVYTDADQVASLILSVPGEALRSGDSAKLVESVEVVYPAQGQ
jgi:hypothetical protein